MYVCNCNAITEREINRAIEMGCDTFARLRDELGVATCCGRCAPDVHAMVGCSHQANSALQAATAG
jgi:bacterioferritin-associated ferredoxin